MIVDECWGQREGPKARQLLYLHPNVVLCPGFVRVVFCPVKIHVDKRTKNCFFCLLAGKRVPVFLQRWVQLHVSAMNISRVILMERTWPFSPIAVEHLRDGFGLSLWECRRFNFKRNIFHRNQSLGRKDLVICALGWNGSSHFQNPAFRFQFQWKHFPSEPKSLDGKAWWFVAWMDFFNQWIFKVLQNGWTIIIILFIYFISYYIYLL